ncbi:hypothetical protein DFJ43DRAFT_1113159 [Lentinula guzmanii]|uniref:Uncharacterized protein n=1 Tax=Lentinula guzmanii TaxID=2804957 RepID=A0AA38N2V4_9AGAR|nr:hypothetical protein DFJ43DRAFT_1113159 [Lentinula guzmanii]
MCVFKRNGDLTRHLNLGHSAHLSASHSTVLPEHQGDSDRWLSPQLQRTPSPLGTAPKARRVLHPHLTGDICDEDGHQIPPDTPPLPPANGSPWAPFKNEAEFRLADHLFRKVEMSQNDIDTLLDIWTLYQHQLSQHQDCDHSTNAPYFNYRDMYMKIDSIADGNAPWRCFQTTIHEELPENSPEWQKTSYQVWYRDSDMVIANILDNTDLVNDFEAAPYIDVDKNGTRRWSNVMSGDFAWRHADLIYEGCEDNSAAGAMLVPIILGADKTTVSVATGHIEYHPLYLTIGNITNEARRSHRNAVIPIAFLAIPKSDRKHDKDNNFHVFKKKLYHQSITAILNSLKPAMTQPVVRRCPDGHFRHIIYELAAFIADYPEQVLLAGIVQGWCGRYVHSSCCDAPFDELETASTRRTRELDTILLEEYGGDGRTLWDNFGIDDDVTPFTAYFPRADIHEMLSADLLHQVIKGCFKDMLIDWVFEYLIISKGESQANIIMDDIDRRLAVVPAFPGLRRFPHGRRFKQWTGDDSKALMKIFLPAVVEYLPQDMLKCLSSFLDFCYLVRRSDIDEMSLNAIRTSIESFQHYRNVFRTHGVREHFSLPRMHSIVHYPQLITDFGVPNGLCSSITESRHISAVKKPWRRSNRYNALSQMLLTNQRNDKLSALRAKLVHLHLLPPLHVSSDLTGTSVDEDFGPIDSGRAIAKVELARTRERAYPRSLQALSAYTNNHQLEELTRRFLHTQLHNRESDIELDDCPHITSKINVYHSAVAVFYAPSDISGIRGMKHERIRSSPSFFGVERRDCVLATVNEKKAGFRGLSAARVLLFFSFRHAGTTYPCALVHWYNTYGQRPDSNTGLWIVKPGYLDQRKCEPFLAVLHLDTLVRAVLLLPVYGPHPIPHKLKYYDSLNLFTAFYVNKYADHHANEILF